jgi:stage V sporulation protein B
VRLEAAGFAVERATTLFGYLAGMALPLVMMATIPTASLALSLVPAIAEAHALGSRAVLRERMATALRLSGIITIPCFCGLAVLAEPVASLLYGTREAALSIRIMSCGIFFLGLHQVTTAALQGIGKANAPMLNMLVSAAAKIGLAWTLTASPSWGIGGAAWASVLDFALAAVLNILFLYKYTGFSLALASIGRIFAAGALMALAVHGFYRLAVPLVNGNVATLLAIAWGGLIYFALLPAFKCVSREEIGKLPVVGQKLQKIFGWEAE